MFNTQAFIISKKNAKGASVLYSSSNIPKYDLLIRYPALFAKKLIFIYFILILNLIYAIKYFEGFATKNAFNLVRFIPKGFLNSSSDYLINQNSSLI